MGWWETNFGISDPTKNASITTQPISSVNADWNKEFGSNTVSFGNPASQIGAVGPTNTGGGKGGSVPVGKQGSATGVPGTSPVGTYTVSAGGKTGQGTLADILGYQQQLDTFQQQKALEDAKYQALIDQLTGQTQGLTGQLSAQNQQFQKLIDQLVGQQSTLSQQSQSQQDQFSQMLGQLTGQIGNITTQFNQQTEQLRTQFNTQLGTLLTELSQAPALQMPDIDKMFAETLSTKQKAVDAQKAEALDRFNREVIPQVRNQLASSGFLNSDQRFALENEARQSLEKTYASIEAQAQADALQEALQKAGLQANVAQTIVDAGLRQKALLLQAQGQLEQQAYQTGSLGMQGIGTALNALLGQGQLDVSRAGQGTQSLGTALDAMLGMGNLGVAQGNLAVNQGNLGLQRDIFGQEYGPSGLKQQGMDLQNKTLQANTENQRMNNLLQALGIMPTVPQMGGSYGGMLSELGITPGAETRAAMDARLARELDERLTNIRASSSGSNKDEDLIGSMTEQGLMVLDTVRDAKTRKDAEGLLLDYGASLSTADRAQIQASIDRKWPVKVKETKKDTGASGGGILGGLYNPPTFPEGAGWGILDSIFNR